MNWYVGNVGGVTDGPFKSRQLAEGKAGEICAGEQPVVTRLAAGFYTVQTFDDEQSLVRELAVFTKAGALRQGFRDHEF